MTILIFYKKDLTKACRVGSRSGEFGQLVKWVKEIHGYNT